MTDQSKTTGAMLLIERSTLVGALASLRIAGVGIQVGERLQLAIDSAEQTPAVGDEPEIRASIQRSLLGKFSLHYGPSESGENLIRLSDHRAHVAPLRAEIERLSTQLDGLVNYLPSPDATNKLPEGIRAYVASLQTLCDPSGIVAENTLLRDQTKQLDAMIGRIKRESVQAEARIAELERFECPSCGTVRYLK